MENPYLRLTAEFNRGRLRAVVSSGQAVVIHRLAVMSKDGDWILREDEEALEHVLEVLAERQACYRFGAPLDRRWLAGGWSAHLEHRAVGLRLLGPARRWAGDQSAGPVGDSQEPAGRHPV